MRQVQKIECFRVGHEGQALFLFDYVLDIFITALDFEMTKDRKYNYTCCKIMAIIRLKVAIEMGTDMSIIRTYYGCQKVQ